MRDFIGAGDKRSGSEAPWSQIKFDRQIAVIAKVNGAHALYMDDAAQSHFAAEAGLRVTHTWELEPPSEYAQGNLFPAP